MAITTFPGNLIPFQRSEERHARQQAEGVSPAPSLLEREELAERLAVMGDVAPAAPLSFLLVRLHARKAACLNCGLPSWLLAALGEKASGLLRPLDALGYWSRTSLGVALQGAGATAAAAVAGRLSHHLNALLQAEAPDFEVRVYIATGYGANAPVLPEAAAAGFGESG